MKKDQPLQYSKAQLLELAIRAGQGVLSEDGSLLVQTGMRTGRSTKERFILRKPSIEGAVDWNTNNQPCEPNLGERIIHTLKERLGSTKSSTYWMDGFAGPFPVKLHSSSPWHVAFAKNMFRSSAVQTVADACEDLPTIEVWHEPFIKVSELAIDWPFECAILLDFDSAQIGIIGTAYAGEIKKAVFSICNFLLTNFGILPMHASANCRQDGSQSCLLFGLSGTGKTTLSADSERFLIGDDEIIWTDDGISNLEAGCYAKLINLDPLHEPEIYRASNQFGSILENVAYDSQSRKVDFFNAKITENTRGSYPLTAIPHCFDQTRQAQPPKTVVFLTADAFGALPAVARLNYWQAQYQFISGYTAKLAGTEIGVHDPKATFSTCFGGPFMPRAASVYAKLLAENCRKFNTQVWLLNTGWMQGGVKSGARFPLLVTRTILRAIQNGKLELIPTVTHPIFNFQVPTECPGVSPELLLAPEGTQVTQLAEKFRENFQRYSPLSDPEILSRGGPQLRSM